MGTTLCAVGATDDGRLAVVNVGDSRAYLVRDDALRQLTIDHNWTAELVRQGELTDQEALFHPHRNILTRALGVAQTVDVDGHLIAVAPSDRLLVCSDGLFTEVDEDEMRAALRSNTDVTTVADALVERALANGARDNVSVVVADVRT
jgi:protein phosphatase